MNFDFDFIFVVLILFLFFLFKKTFLSDIKKKKPYLHPFGYRLIYTDQKIECGEDVVVSKLLKSEKFAIQGKPDFLFKNFFGNILPVELKSGSIGDSSMPRFGDLMQISAYFIIVEEIYGKKPKYGNLIYKDFMFKIKNTRTIRREVIKIVSQMNKMLETGKGEVSPDPSKCRFCLCKGVCKFFDRKK